MTRARWNPFLRFPWVSLLVCAAACVPLLRGLLQFRVGAEAEALLSGDQRNLASYEQVRDILGDTEALVLSLELTNLFTQAGLDVVREISGVFERQPDVFEVKSLTHSVKPVRRGLSFDMVPLVPPGPLTAGELARVADFCLTHPLARNLLVSADGQHTLITVHYDRRRVGSGDQEQFRERVESALAPFRQQGLKLRLLALPLIEGEIRRTLRHDLAWFVPAALGVVCLVLYLTFRSVRLVLFTLVSQAAFLALIPGIIQATGFRLNVFSVTLGPLITGIQLTLLMHLLTGFQRALETELDTDAALRATLEVVGRPALFSTLTTVLGLLSLGTSNLEPVRDFGWLGALCLIAVHAFTFGPVVALLKIIGTHWPLPARRSGAISQFGPARPPSSRLAERWVALVSCRSRIIRRASLLAVLLALAGLALVRTDVRVIEMLSPRSPTRQALEELDRTYGGINVVQIELDSGRTNGLNDPVFLRYLDRVQRYAASRPEPTGVFSYAQLLAIVNQIWEGGRMEALRLPEQPWLLALFTTAVRSYQFPFLVALADADFQVAQLVVRTRDMPAADYLRMIGDIVRFAEDNRPAGVRVSAAKGLHSILEADRRIMRSQASSAGSALLLIALALALLWRSVRLAGLGVGANALAVGFTLALAGFAQVPLNSITVMVGALALGITQDDTVHFISFWQACRRLGLGPVEALAEAFRIKGRPIIWTTVILVAVFGLFALSSFPPVVGFGLLLATAFIVAQVCLLLLLPAWLLQPGNEPDLRRAPTVPAPSSS